MGVFDLLVVGAGPAGLGAAIQAAHAGWSVAVLDMRRPLSRLMLAGRVENFPGQPGLAGPVLLDRMRGQARAKGVTFVAGRCLSLGYAGKLFRAETSGRALEARAAIVATGLEPKKLGAKVSPGRLEGRRVFYRWTDIPLGSGARVLVIGGGEAAFDQACSLAERGCRVTMAVRGANDRVFPALRDRAASLGVVARHRVSVVKIEETVPGVMVNAETAGRPARIGFDFCLAAIGGRKSLPETAPTARARLNHGLWLAGEAADPRWRQAAIAYGDGIKKAMRAGEYLKTEGK